MGATQIIYAFHAFAAVMLIIAALSDLRNRTIPNWLTGALALGALPVWLAAGMQFWPAMAIQLGIAALAFGIFATMFYLGAMGGGDVKLIGALALWLPLVWLIQMLLIMSLIGGVITLGMWIGHKARKSREKLEVPYGIAIAIAGLWAIYERYLNHFG
jgi:prepilin peptidase CpaA